MGGMRLVAPVLVAVLALTACGESAEPPGGPGLPVADLPRPVQDEVQEPVDDPWVAGGQLAWAGYDAAFGAISTQVLGTPIAGVAYVVRASCLSEVPVDLWFEVAVDDVPAAEGVFGCSGSEAVTPLGELPEAATVTLQLRGEVELIDAASVVVAAGA